jgi:hypothetical protein
MRRVSATEKVAGLLTIATWAARMDVYCTGVSHLYIYWRTGGCCHKVLACLYPDCRISRKAGVKINKLVLLSCTILPMSICYIQKIVSSLELECCNNNINLFLLSRPSTSDSIYMKCQNVSLSYDETKMTCTGYPAACWVLRRLRARKNS